jgi:hypothetical protein
MQSQEAKLDPVDGAFNGRDRGASGVPPSPSRRMSMSASMDTMIESIASPIASALNRSTPKSMERRLDAEKQAARKAMAAAGLTCVQSMIKCTTIDHSARLTSLWAADWLAAWVVSSSTHDGRRASIVDQWIGGSSPVPAGGAGVSSACSGWGGRTRSSPDQSRAEVEPAAAETHIGACSEMAHSGGPGTLRRLSISLQASLSKLDQRSPVASQAADISAVGAVEEVAPPIQYRVVAPGAVREGPELESVKIAQLAVGDVITVHQHAPLSGGAYRAWRVHFTREGSSLSGWASTSTKKGTQLLELMNADKVAAAKMEVLMAQQQEEEEEEEEEQEEESAAPEPEAESELPAEDADAAPDEEVQSAVAAWLAERGHEGTSEAVCESLRDAEIAPAEWLAELAEIEQSGQLAEFIASEVKAWEAAEVEAQAEAQAEAEAALARQRAAASMRAAAQAVAVREEAATKLQASARGMAVRRTRRQALAADDTVQAEADVQQQPPSPHPPGTRSTAADAAPPHQGMAWYRVLNFGAIRAGVALSSPKVGATVVGESILVTQRVVHEDGTVRLQFERGWVSEHGRKGTKLLEFVRETGAPLAAQQALQERVESALEKQSERAVAELTLDNPPAHASQLEDLETQKERMSQIMKQAGIQVCLTSVLTPVCMVCIGLRKL